MSEEAQAQGRMHACIQARSMRTATTSTSPKQPRQVRYGESASQPSHSQAMQWYLLSPREWTHTHVPATPRTPP